MESSAPDEDEDEDPEPIITMHEEKVESSSADDTIKETEECECDSKTESSCHNIADQSFDMATHI